MTLITQIVRTDYKDITQIGQQIISIEHKLDNRLYSQDIGWTTDYIGRTTDYTVKIKIEQQIIRTGHRGRTTFLTDILQSDLFLMNLLLDNDT